MRARADEGADEGEGQGADEGADEGEGKGADEGEGAGRGGARGLMRWIAPSSDRHRHRTTRMASSTPRSSSRSSALQSSTVMSPARRSISASMSMTRRSTVAAASDGTTPARQQTRHGFCSADHGASP